MGRPLNKKYFGNRNTGSASVTTDDGIGGGAVASVSAGTVGSFVVTDTYKNFPTLTVAVPTIPGGVRAVLTPVYELDTVTFASGGQTNADYVAGLSTTITGLGGGAIVNIVETSSKVTAVNLTGGNRGEFRRGDFDGTGITTHQVLQAPNAGTDLQITVTFRVKRIEVTEAGSGYVGTPALTWGGHTFTDQTTPSAQTVTMLTDSGNVGTVGNQENAIQMVAFLTDGSAGAVDIIRQVSTNRYKVTDGTRTGIVALTSTEADAAGEGSIQLVDTDGGTYFATKLTARKVTITRGTGVQDAFPTGAQVQWNMTAATASSLLIANA
jgi:hypothetical protein